MTRRGRGPGWQNERQDLGKWSSRQIGRGNPGSSGCGCKVENGRTEHPIRTSQDRRQRFLKFKMTSSCLYQEIVSSDINHHESIMQKGIVFYTHQTSQHLLLYLKWTSGVARRMERGSGTINSWYRTRQTVSKPEFQRKKKYSPLAGKAQMAIRLCHRKRNALSSQVVTEERCVQTVRNNRGNRFRMMTNPDITSYRRKGIIRRINRE